MSILLLQMCTGIHWALNNPNDTDVSVENYTTHENLEKVLEKTRGIVNETDPMGGSWFDDFEDERGIEWKNNVSVGNGKVESDCWKYQRTINLSNNGAALENYSVRLDLTSQNFDYSHPNTEGDDIRFNHPNGGKLSYWIEEWNVAGTSRIWVNVTNIPNGNSHFFMLYGNPNASSDDDGDATFEFFDDFEDDSYTDKWVGSGTWAENSGTIKCTENYRYLRTKNQVLSGLSDFAVEGRTRSLTSTGYGMRLAIKSDQTPAEDENQYEPRGVETNSAQSPYFIIDNSDKGSGGQQSSVNVWYKVKVIIHPSGSHALFQYKDDGTSFGNVTGVSDDSISNNNYLAIITVDGQTEQDWIFIRKYNISEPATSIGVEYQNPTNESIISVPIKRGNTHHWSTLYLEKIEPANTYINISVINAGSNTTIPGFDNLTSSTIDISNITTSPIRLRAWFEGDGQNTPILDSWGVEWTAKNTWRDSFSGDGKCIYPVDVDEHTVGYWKFEEGSGNKTRDFSGNGNNGTLNDMEKIDWVDGKYGGGLNFDGQNEYVDVGTNPSLDVGNGNFTVSAWIKYSSTSGSARGIVDISAFNTDFMLCTGKLGKQDSVGLAINGFWYRDAGSGLNDNEWHYIVGTKSGGMIKIYADGISYSYGTGSLTHTGYNRIGTGHNDFEGIIDEVRISKVVRTPQEIQQAYQTGISIRGGQGQLANNEIVAGQNTSSLWHFNEGEGNILHDSSGNGNDGVVQGASWVDGVMGKALEFDGEGDYVEIIPTHNINNDNGTAMLWVKTNWEDNVHYGLLNFGDNDNTDHGDIALVFLSGSIYSWVDPPPQVQPSVPVDWKNDEWHHIGMSWNNTKLILYLDGENVANVQIDSFPNITKGHLGCRYTNGPAYYLKGIIDEVSIYNRALNGSEILTHANLYQHNATLHSVPITLHANQTWDTFHCNRSVPDNTRLNISIHDAKTNETLWTEYNRTDAPHIDLSGTDPIEHPSIYIQAHFQSNRTETPVLYDWAVNWTDLEEVILYPELYEEIGNISFYEDTVALNKLNLINYFQDVNDLPSLMSFTIQRTEGQYINATINVTKVSFKTDIVNWTGAEIFKVRCTNGFNKTIESNEFNVNVIPVDDRPMWKHHIPDVVISEDNSSKPIKLTEIVEDAEDDLFDFTCIVNGNNEMKTNISVNITQGNMIIIPAVNWFGNSTVEISAYQISNNTLNSTITFDVKVTSKNDLPVTNLRYPENGSKFNTREITLNWSGLDVDCPIDAIRYDVYLSNNLTSGLFGNAATYTNLDSTSLTLTLDYGQYYWTVIGFDGIDYGACADGYLTFNITNISIPEVELLSPASNSSSGSSSTGGAGSTTSTTGGTGSATCGCLYGSCPDGCCGTTGSQLTGSIAGASWEGICSLPICSSSASISVGDASTSPTSSSSISSFFLL